MELDETLAAIYTARRAKALANLRILIQNPVGISQHSDIVAETDKLVQQIAEADGCLEALSNYLKRHSSNEEDSE
tara:strand:+ start:114 stop:338 length:225 start_codon:yes stop_codon:yes gene_type:complete